MNKFKILSLVAAIGAFGFQLIGNYASEKQQEKTIKEEVKKYIESQ